MKQDIPDQERDFALIGRFFDFALSEAELKDFETRLDNDPVLQERFRLYRDMEQHLDQHLPAQSSLSAPPGAGEPFQADAVKQEAKIKPLVSRKIWSVAATIALLLIAGLWWINRSAPIGSPEALADHYWNATEKEHLFDAAQRGDSAKDPNEQARTFFRSIRDLQEKGDYTAVIDQLEIYKVATPAPIPFEDDADWLLAIAYLGNKDLKNARIQLENIIKAYPARRKTAQQLLDDIQRLEESSGEEE